MAAEPFFKGMRKSRTSSVKKSLRWTGFETLGGTDGFAGRGSLARSYEETGF